MRTTRKKHTELQWTVGPHATAEATPENWVPAQVPGAVQLDWARAENWPPHWYGENWREYAWMEDHFWTYRTTLPAIDIGSNERLFFVCGGVDYQFEILLNDNLLHAQEGMFTPVELELPPDCAGQELRVRVFPIPKSVDAPRSRVQANRSCKPAVSYGWDWHPRLVPLGIWDDTFLEVRPAAFLQKAEVFQQLNNDFSSAELRLETTIDGVSLDGLQVRWRVLSPRGETVHERITAAQSTLMLSVVVENPQLWWPHDHGEPALYLSQIELLRGDEVQDAHSVRSGLRRVQLVMHEGAWNEPSRFPKSRSTPPITLEINGRRIFAKGSNYVNPDIFPGAVTREQLRSLVELARKANMNLFRMWGGAPVQKRAFFELCDELGVMVWQEFPLACNLYPDDGDYLTVLDAESRSIIIQLRGYASVVFWCGGNELFNSWSGMTDQSLPLRLLNKNCYELDAARPYLPTSPVMGMGHGHYVFYDVDNNEEAWAAFQNADCTAYTEFGCPGPSPVDVLQSFIPPDELFPPRPGTSWESHHAYGVWMENSWLCEDAIEKYFGPSSSLEELVSKGELLQCEGYKGLFEEARRQKPKSSMALNWCFNEAWPCAANNSLICWPAKPKPALYAVGAGCRPILASARIPKFQWRQDENFEAELWLLNDAPREIEAGQMEAILRIDGREVLLLTWNFDAVAENRNRRGPKVQIALPASGADRLELHLRVRGHDDWNSVYTLAYQPREAPKAFHGDTLNF